VKAEEYTTGSDLQGSLVMDIPSVWISDTNVTRSELKLNEQ